MEAESRARAWIGRLDAAGAPGARGHANPGEAHLAMGSAAVVAAPYRGSRPMCGGFESLRFDPLPASRREVSEVAALWGPGAVRETGPAASEAAFKALAPGRAVLHIASHGYFLGPGCSVEKTSAAGARGARADSSASALESEAVLRENPLIRSGLALAGANRRARTAEGEEDGILTAEEIAAMDLSGVRWVVLSACETGLGELRAAEGVFGLRRAFQVAGAASLVMSLWSVRDDAARLWMRHFYESRLHDHMGAPRAARMASLSLLAGRRTNGQSTHPYYWASFVTAGDWR